MKDPVRKRMQLLKGKILKGDSLMAAPSTAMSNSREWYEMGFRTMFYSFRIVRSK
jgi:hypothetical protein